MLWSVGAWCCGVDVPSPSNPLSVSCQRCITLKVARRRWKKLVRYEVFWNVRNEESGHLIQDKVSLQFFRWLWLRCQAPYLQTSRENSSLLSSKPRLTWQWIFVPWQFDAVRISYWATFGTSAKEPIWSPKIHFQAGQLSCGLGPVITAAGQKVRQILFGNWELFEPLVLWPKRLRCLHVPPIFEVTTATIGPRQRTIDISMFSA